MSWSADYRASTDDEGAMDRAWMHHGASSDTYGAGATHALSPSEMTMLLEEHDPRSQAHAETERGALRCEIFSAFAEYLFADGPEPEQVRLRIAGFLESFAPHLPITGPLCWVSAKKISSVLSQKRYAAHFRSLKTTSPASLYDWSCALDAEADLQGVRQIIVALIALLLSEGRKWRILVAVSYCLAKALRPHLLAGMSLHDIAILSGDSGRATPAERIKRLYNRRLAAAGYKACFVHFQKSAGACARYSSAQVGNSNRSAKHKTKPSRR